MSRFGLRVQAYVALTAVCMIAVAGCATLPDTAAKTNAAIRNARDHINLESYIIEDDEIGRQFADLLLQQQARGVQLNIIYDIVRAIGSTPDDPFSLIYLTLISAIGNAQRQVDWRSFVDNDEVNVVVLGRDFAQQMLTAFTRDLQASQNIDLPTWERRPLGLRLKEWAARMWARLL